MRNDPVQRNARLREKVLTNAVCTPTCKAPGDTRSSRGWGSCLVSDCNAVCGSGLARRSLARSEDLRGNATPVQRNATQ